MLKSLDDVTFLCGSAEAAAALGEGRGAARRIFDEGVIGLLDKVSGILMKSRDARRYSDVATFAFWIRRASAVRMREAREAAGGPARVGRGVAFHIAPSNVPVNFAYSLAAGLLAGNANIVRVPSGDFPQVGIIADAFSKALEGAGDEMARSVILARYGHDREANDAFSSIADVRVVWGGDATIAELRKSPLPPRSTEVTFADRYSIAVIDSDIYLGREDKDRIAEGFYNDTFLMDQNACTSPRVIAWLGGSVGEARREFWAREAEYARGRYELQDVSAVDKLDLFYRAAAAIPGLRLASGAGSGEGDNLIVRIEAREADARLMEYRGNCGYFYEAECDSVGELAGLCDDLRCQTVGCIGREDELEELACSGIRGIDRIVPIGKTMDFDLTWDGTDLIAALSRAVSVTRENPRA